MKKSVRMYIDVAMQGLFFRNFVKEEAKKHELGGFIKGLEDGRIEVFLEGDSVKVDEMTEICRKGPKHAQIRNSEAKDNKSIKSNSVEDKSIREVKRENKSFFSKIIDDLSDEK